MNHYLIRAESPEQIVAMLEAAQAGKAEPFVNYDENAAAVIDAARIVLPRAETEPGEPFEFDGMTIVPQVPTGFWLCEIFLMEPDAELEASAVQG